MTNAVVADAGRMPGIRHVDHVAFTVPDLDDAVAFFTSAFGAEELYRSQRGPDATFMTENFEMPEDAALTLCMLRLPPNLNVELFQWSGSDLATSHPRHGDAGGHHLAFEVEDVDAAVAHLEHCGARALGRVKHVADDSPVVAGNRWTYLRTPWGLLVELVDRSRVVHPPRLVGPMDWRVSP